MKFLISLSLSLIALSSEAAFLLIPTQDISAKTYFDWCYRENYSCTTDMFVNDIKNKRAEEFNKLMDQVDLSSPTFTELFKNSIIRILNEEDLDLTQLEMLLDLLKDLNAKQPSLLFKMIENELVRTKDLVLTAENFDNSEFVLIFKKAIPVHAAKKIKTSLLKIPLYLISYSDIPVKSDTTSFNRTARKPLISGDCGRYKLNLELEKSKWILLKATSCLQKNDEQKIQLDRFKKEAHH